MEFKKIVDELSNKKSNIKDEKLKANINLADNEKEYRILSKKLAQKIYEKNLHKKDFIVYKAMDDCERKAIENIRKASANDREHLKGDYVIEGDIKIKELEHKIKELEHKIKELEHKRPEPPTKRLQLSNKNLEKLFYLHTNGLSMRKIAKNLNIDYRTVSKILNLNYQNKNDIKRIINAKK